MQAQADREDQLNLERQLNLEDPSNLERQLNLEDLEGQLNQEKQDNQESQENQASRADEPREGDDPEGESPKGESPEGDDPKGESPKGESPKGESPKGESPEDEPQAGENTETRRTRILNRYVVLTMEKRALQAREKIINEELEKLEEVVKDIFIESGWTSVATTKGTVYIHRDVVARLRKDEDGGFDQAHQALEDCGLGYMVKGNVNTSSLGAYVREREKYKEEIPLEAAQWIIKTELFRARVRAPA
jgi:hypothetical protein